MKDIIKIIPDSREDWLQHRSESIGGSELATMLGFNPYQSPYNLWSVKTGREQGFTGNNATLRGRFIEKGIADYWEWESGNNLIKASEGDIIYKHTKHRVSGSPDFRYFPKDTNNLSERGILEVKTTKTNIAPEDISLSWFLQPNLYAGMLGYNKFTIVWFSMFSDELQYIEYDFDKEMYEMCLHEADKWWNTYIIEDTPPPLSNGADVVKMYPQHEEGKTLIATDEIQDVYSKGIDIKRKIKGLNVEYATLVDPIKVIMKDAEKIITPTMETIFSYRTNKKGSRVFLIKEV
jgi:predicted phage-related endonuclease